MILWKSFLFRMLFRLFMAGLWHQNSDISTELPSSKNIHFHTNNKYKQQIPTTEPNSNCKQRLPTTEPKHECKEQLPTTEPSNQFKQQIPSTEPSNKDIVFCCSKVTIKWKRSWATCKAFGKRKKRKAAHRKSRNRVRSKKERSPGGP